MFGLVVVVVVVVVVVFSADRLMLLGTLSNDDDDGSENVAKKLNLCSFKLTHVYMDPLNMPSASDFSWS